MRKACGALVEAKADQIIVAISRWARDGSYGISLGEDLSDELRPPLCEEELGVCTSEELEELVEVDAEEDARSPEPPAPAPREPAAPAEASCAEVAGKGLPDFPCRAPESV